MTTNSTGEAMQQEAKNKVDSVGIETVNSRKGGAQGASLAKMVFGALLFLVVCLGAYFLYAWLGNDDAKKPKEKEGEIASAKKAQVTGYRADLGVPQAAPAQPKEIPKDPLCATTELLGPDGRPIIGPGGQSIKVDCRGKAANTAATVPALDVSKAPVQGGEPIKKPDRFAGDPFASMASPVAGSGLTAAPSYGGVSQGKAQAQAATQASIERIQAAGRTGNASASAFPSSANAGVPNQQGGVGSLLNPTDVARVTATKLGNTALMLPQGTLIPCTLTTKVISEISGFATCILSQNVYSADGKTVLFDRGSTAMGEYVAGVAQGTRFLHVLWNRVRTPHNIVVNIASPSASTLGTIGLAGYVDNRWFDRLGAALLLSLLQDGVSYSFNALNQPAGGQYIKGEQETSSTTRQTSTIVGKDGNSSTSERTTTSAPSAAVVIPPATQNISGSTQKTQESIGQMAEKVLGTTINIKPVMYKNQGDKITIFVARDVFFDGVYALTDK